MKARLHVRGRWLIFAIDICLILWQWLYIVVYNLLRLYVNRILMIWFIGFTQLNE